MRVWAAFIASIVFGVTMVRGYIYDDAKAKVLRKWDPQNNRYHYWIGFCDFHDKMHPANNVQRQKIEEVLLKSDTRNMLVLVEDLSSANQEGCLGCGSFYINSKVGILAGLANFCNSHAIPVHNVEYRYCRVVTLGPVINNITADPTLFPSTRKMTIGHLSQEIERVYNELLLGAQGASFKTELNRAIADIKKNMHDFNFDTQSDKSIARYVAENSTPINRNEMVKNILTFDGILLGLRLVDATLNNQHKEKIVSFAGGTHILEAYDLLQKVGGYEPVLPSSGGGGAPPAPISSTISTGSIGILQTKPKPISLELLEHYLKN